MKYECNERIEKMLQTKLLGMSCLKLLPMEIRRQLLLFNDSVSFLVRKLEGCSSGKLDSQIVLLLGRGELREKLLGLNALT